MQNNLDIILQQISKGQILTTEQVDKFLTMVLTSLSTQKKELDKETKQRMSELAEVMKYIEKEHKNVLKDWEDKLDNKTTEAYNKVKTGFNTEITKAKEIIQELRSIKLRDGIDGKDGEPGKDADETKIVAKVLKKLPKSKDYSAVGIKDMLESLEDDDRLDYGVLKNIPDLSQLANPIMAGAGGRLLSQMNDVDISGVTDNSVLIWDEERSIWKIGTTSAGSGTVTSVSVVTANGISGTVANPTTTPAITLDISGLDATKIADGSISNTEFQYLNGVSSNIQTQLDGKVDENAAITGATKTKITYDAKGLVTGGADATTADIADTTNKRYVTDAQLTVIGNTSGTNTGDQTSIVGITGTKTQFDTAVTDGNFLYVGDVSQYTDELAQDAVGGIMTDSAEIDFTYNDATPSITASIVAGSIDETKLDASTNASLDLADSAVQAASTNTLTNKTLTTPVINGATLNGDIQVDATPNSDDTWNGKSTNTFNAGATVAQFDCVYLSSSSTWLLTDADAIGTAGNVLVMMAGAAGTNGNPLRVIEPGSWVRNDAWNWTVGGVLYLDTATPGGLTQTAPSGEDDAVKIVGHAVTADVIYFAPSVNWIIYKS